MTLPPSDPTDTATWTVEGILYSTSQPATVTWAHGHLSGSADALRDIDKIVSRGTTAVTPTGPYLASDKNDETSAFVMALNTMRNANISGQPPTIELPELPDGAIP